MKIRRPLIVLSASVCSLFALACETTPTAGRPMPNVPAGRYDWQQPHAKVLESGDLEWAPRPHAFTPGQTVRYIDYEGGSDANSGTRARPWKHHPWDPQATGRAAEATGPITYVFKRGVIYRGRLVADESGRPDEPIRLTSDPEWGSGEAMFYGSMPLEGGWRRGRADTVPEGMPEPEKVWWVDVGTDFHPRSVWVEDDGRIDRLALAREPNWTVGDHWDVRHGWYEWQEGRTVEVDIDGQMRERSWAKDAEHLAGRDEDFFEGGTVWTEYPGVMGSPYANPIEDYNPETGEIRFGGPWGSAGTRYEPRAHLRYYIENLPQLLDQAGEFWYAPEGHEHAGRLFVRLADDRNPNHVRIEAARTVKFITIPSRSNIHVSGLTFRFGNVAHWYDRWWTMASADAACVTAMNNAANIRVSNCTFEHVPRAVHYETAQPGTRMQDVAITDCEISEADYGPIYIRQGGGGKKDQPAPGAVFGVEILRNRLYNVGLRPMRAHHGHAIQLGYARTAHVAGNFLDRSYGAGLFMFGAKGGGQYHDVPLSRVLVHHNKITSPLLRSNDWGGIEAWQSGPFYIYNNVSGNPGGYWHYRHVAQKDPDRRSHVAARFSFAYYLDGGFKNYLFNNIAWGLSSDLGSPLTAGCGLQEIIGFMNAFFNNTFYRFGAGSRRQAPMAGRCFYLGNVWQDMGEYFIRHAHPRTAPSEANAADEFAAGDPEAETYAYETLAYANNVFYGEPRHFGIFEHVGRNYESIEQFRQALKKRDVMATSTGVMAEKSPLRDPANHDFRPLAGSAVDNRGVKFFVPWSLSGVVGEWNFYRMKNPKRVLGENWYMTDEYYHRSMYRFVPLRDLRAPNATADSFVTGELEDWIAGAMVFNGRDQYCVMTHEDMIAGYEFKGGDRQRIMEGSYPGPQRKTLDMDSGNFSIEVYLRVKKGDTDSTIVSKTDGSTGYALRVNEQGAPMLVLMAEDKSDVQVIAGRINDGKWHHLFAEVDRGAGLARCYVDGKLSGALVLKEIGPSSLSNTGDFYVGRGVEGEYFAGAIDFLRISRGTLADALTTIEELRTWQFNGPQFGDFTGRSPQDAGRDAGAIEGR